MVSKKNTPVYMGWFEFATGIVLWTIVGIVLFSTSGMPAFEQDNSPGPRFVPLGIAITLSFLTVLYWVEAYKNREKSIQLPSMIELAKPSMFFGLALLVVLLWDILGAAPVVFLISFMEFKLLEKYTWNRSLLVAAILCSSTFVLFEMVLGISLPRGLF